MVRKTKLKLARHTLLRASLSLSLSFALSLVRSLSFSSSLCLSLSSALFECRPCARDCLSRALLCALSSMLWGGYD